MKIEIITTKRKLTKSLVKQMHNANFTHICQAADIGSVTEILGYVTDCEKSGVNLAIIHHINDYYTIPMYEWSISSVNDKRVCAKGNREVSFNNSEDAFTLIESMKKIRHSLVGRHIYL